MLQYAPAQSAEVAPSVDVARAGFDPALLQALEQGNPLALDATAGLFDNSLIQSLTTRQPASAPAQGDLRGGLFPDGSLGDREAENETDREIDWANDELDRREGPPSEQSDGSGEHGQFDPTAVDHANHAFWRGVAVAAEAGGLVNAARHMNHYLDNTGAPLAVDPELILRDVPVAADELAYHQGVVTDLALESLDGADPMLGGSFPVSSPMLSKDVYYFTAGASEDWYFAVGGHSAGFDGTFTFVPDGNAQGTGTMVFEGVFHVADQYNWDQGKSVTIAGVTVDDAVLGRLHKVGLAHEFPITGEMPLEFQMKYWGQDVTPNIPDADPAEGREGTRVDPDRERT